MVRVFGTSDEFLLALAAREIGFFAVPIHLLITEIILLEHPLKFAFASLHRSAVTHVQSCLVHTAAS